MACNSCASTKPDITNSQRWRRVLWIALAVNAVMFFVELSAGVAGGSKSLQADALDFLGDAANYAISLGVAGMALAWRARAALLKGATLMLFGGYVLATATWAFWFGRTPEAEVMGLVGIIAFLANAAVAVLLYRYRDGDANMRSVWICSRNDVLGNLAVIFAAAGVFGTGAAWPDLIVAAIMALLAISGGIQIIQHARRELVAAVPSTARTA